MAPAIFKDKELQAKFEKDGFVVVPFLMLNEIAELKSLFYEMHPDLPTDKGFVSGSYSNDFEYKKTASDKIVSVFKKRYESLFQNYQPFGAAFLYKQPNQLSELGIHQDWTIVDEEKFVALNCWVPLTDITKSNGALHVIKGSHYQQYKTLRAPTIPFFFSGNEKEMISRAQPFYVKAGEAVILNQSVVHYSPANQSNQIRIAITAGIKTAGAPMIFHFMNSEKKIFRYEMPEDFLLRFENFAQSIFDEPALGKCRTETALKTNILDKKELFDVLDRIENKDEKSWFNKIKKIFQS